MTPRFDIRVSAEEKERLFAAARERDLSAAALVKEQLGAILTGKPARAKADVADPPAKETAEQPAQTLDFARFLSARTGVPEALCRRQIRQGRVTVEGHTVTEERLAEPPQGIEVDQVAV